MAPREICLIFWKIQNIVRDISPPISYFAKFWFSSYGSKCCWPIKLQDSLKCNIPKKKWMMKFIFGMQIDVKVFDKLILSFWVCVAIHTQSTQNKKFIYISLQYLQENMGEKVDFSLVKYKSSVKVLTNVDTVFLRCAKPGISKAPKIISLQYLCNILRKM